MFLLFFSRQNLTRTVQSTKLLTKARFTQIAMASSSRQQPPWQRPTSSSADMPPLKLYNSLTRSPEAFIPIDRRKISWYACGPTVYDDSHLGHARNYVTTDIIRRILQDYFKYKIRFVMNVTDIDDKVCITFSSTLPFVSLYVVSIYGGMLLIFPFVSCPLRHKRSHFLMSVFVIGWSMGFFL